MPQSPYAPNDDPKPGDDPHPDYDPTGSEDNPRDLNDDGRVTKRERQKFKETKQAFNKWWKRASERGEFNVPAGVSGAFREAAFEAWLDGYTPQQLNRLFQSRAATVLFGNSEAAGLQGFNTAAFDAQLEFLSDPEHFQAFIDSIQPGGAGTEYIKQVFSGGGFAEWAEANGVSTDDPNASTLYHEYRTGLHQAFYDANPGLQEFRASELLQARDERRAAAQESDQPFRPQAANAATGQPGAGGVYMNINPEIPYQQTLAPMGNILAQNAAQAFSIGDPDAIQNARDRMSAYAEWNSQFNSVFGTPTPVVTGGQPDPFDLDEFGG